ncbi:FAD-dependent oxidoreductase [Marinilabilia rubra]|uniref:Pyridine nucleotide-disulfide oxidoreductase n=1 Tax=Marinilabilia rubra TaxID=2162893 RepID=A0A2U2BB67_9BACT|nr:FAD-dependent oxidoreductase [Marinilabilia rubra]PWE00315.1 hypothetical protein DDZ16_05080 [Marinilabilia rubra]
MKKILIGLLSIVLFSCQSGEEIKSLLIEAESFDEKGGWSVDPQFVEQMGSPYLIAHGMGSQVEDASTSFMIEEKGTYHVWVRTKDWAPGNWEAPGQFKVSVNHMELSTILGTREEWGWQYAGNIKLEKGTNTLGLIDLTGFNGRCDAIYLSQHKKEPEQDNAKMVQWRQKLRNESSNSSDKKEYDLVITGGGLAGCAAAIAAAEQGLKTALIHDRPVLGGNASNEIRVHTLGIYGHFERILKMIDTEHYPNGSPKAAQEDEKRLKNIQKYKNIDLYLDWRAHNANSNDNYISHVDARHNQTGERIRFKAPYFVDCTGDGWIGYWAGAERMYGRESSDTYDEHWEQHGELWSPEKADNFVMGSSLLWRSHKVDSTYVFPEVPWAMDVVGGYAAKEGSWKWEYSDNDLHQVDDAEQIRDHMLKAIYGSFYNEKQKAGNDSLSLEWVGFLLGKRESYRLVGDHVYNFNDVKNNVAFRDSVVVEERAVDVHFQQYLEKAHKPDFLSEALFYRSGRYYVPYRSLYSKNINNLFMAGRCFSCTHLGLGGPRVMLTTGQMGAAVGYAASICKKYNVKPREVYEKYLDEYMALVLSSDKHK